jgi:hypothetical protein
MIWTLEGEQPIRANSPLLIRQFNESSQIMSLHSGTRLNPDPYNPQQFTKNSRRIATAVTKT